MKQIDRNREDPTDLFADRSKLEIRMKRKRRKFVRYSNGVTMAESLDLSGGIRETFNRGETSVDRTDIRVPA